MDLKSWIESKKEAKNNIITINDAILYGEWNQYFYYRLKYFLANYSIQVLIHLMEVFLFFHLFTSKEFLIVSSLKIITGMITSFWWGYLESYREEIRNLFSAHQFVAVDKLIKKTIKNSIYFSIATVLCFFIITLFLDGLDLKKPLPLLTFSLIALRFLVDIIVNTFHTGVYAITRIQRPFWSIAVIQISYILFFLLFWPLFEYWSFIPAFIINMIIDSYLKYFYVKKSYLFYEPSPKLIQKIKHPAIGKVSFSSSLISGISFISTRLEGFIFLTFFSKKIQFSFSDQYDEFFLMFLIFPIYSATSDWARIMYFDLKKLNRTLWGKVQSTYLKRSLILSIALSFIFFATAMGIYLFFVDKNLSLLILSLLIYFLTKTPESFLKIFLFSEQRYFLLLTCNLVTLLPFIFNIHHSYSLPEKILFLSMISVLNSLLLALIVNFSKRIRIEGPSSFFWFIKKRKNDLFQVGTFDLVRENSNLDSNKVSDWVESQKWYRSLLLKKLNVFLSPKGKAIHFYPGRIFWFSFDQDSKIKESIVNRLTGSTYANLRIEYQNEISEKLFPNQVINENPLESKEILSQFKYFGPEGHLIDFNSVTLKANLLKDKLSNEKILKKAQYYIENLDYLRSGKYCVDCLITNGEVEYLFVYPVNHPRRDSWQKLLYRQNLSFGA